MIIIYIPVIDHDIKKFLSLKSWALLYLFLS